MQNIHRFTFWSLLCIIFQAGFSDATISVEVHTNKSSFRVGDPAVLRTTIRNTGTEVMTSFEIGWSYGFTLAIAKDGGDYSGLIEARGFRVTKPPVQNELFRDRYALWGGFRPGEAFRRADLISAEPGVYRVKAVVEPHYYQQQNEGRKDRFESNEVTFEIKLPPESDCVYQVIPREEMEKLGETIVMAHYRESAGTLFHTSDGLHRKEFGEVAKEILGKCPDTWLREALIYSYVLSQGRARIKGGWPISDPEVRRMADGFMTEYPDSWLLPEVARVLMVTHYHEGNREALLGLYERVTGAGPEDLAIRGDIPGMLRELEQKQP